MIKCKYCNKTFNSFSKFQRHLHQNICIPNTVAKKKKNEHTARTRRFGPTTRRFFPALGEQPQLEP